MFNFKTTLSALVLTAGIASAASPATLTSLVTNVQMVPNYTGASSPYSEGTTGYFINIGGTLYASYYSSDKNKAFFELAKQAAASGKKVYIRYDTDASLGLTTCSDYASNGCIVKGYPTYGYIIQELALVP